MQKQTKLGGLLSEQLFDERRLSASFVEMAGALPCRPEPRHLFDNAASPGRVEYYGHRLVVGADAVLNAALTLRDRGVLEQTALRVRKHVNELGERMLLKYSRVASGAVSLNDAADESAAETGRLSAALTRWAIRHDDAARVELIRQIDAEVTELRNLRCALERPHPALNDRPQLVRA